MKTTERSSLEVVVTKQRLRLEVLAPRHAVAFLAYRQRNREHLRRWEPATSPDAFTPAYQEGDIAASRSAAERGESLRFLAFELDGDDVVASVNLWEIRRGVVQAAVLGYSVDAGFEDRGYATEAAGAVVAYAFDTLNLHRVETTYQPTNERSGRVLRKLGFVVEGYARDYLLLDGAWRDAIFVARHNARWTP